MATNLNQFHLNIIRQPNFKILFIVIGFLNFLFHFPFRGPLISSPWQFFFFFYGIFLNPLSISPLSSHFPSIFPSRVPSVGFSAATSRFFFFGHQSFTEFFFVNELDSFFGGFWQRNWCVVAASSGGPPAGPANGGLSNSFQPPFNSFGGGGPVRYRVLPSFTEFYLFCLVLFSFYLVFTSFIEFYLDLPSFTLICLVLFSFYLVWPSLTLFCLVLPSFYLVLTSLIKF